MNAFDFLPENYEAPKVGGGYMKIAKGENKIRILSAPVLGWEEWGADKKPVRYTMEDRPEKALDPLKPPAHFWAFVVWNYKEECIQILQVRQAGIRKGLEALCKDADWGAPYFYDIKIFREGEDLKTKYTVNPLPHKQVGLQIVAAFNDKRCYLPALFCGEDPFAGHWAHPTPGVFDRSTGPSIHAGAPTLAPIRLDVITKEQASDLSLILNNCDPVYKESVMSTLRKEPFNVNELGQIKISMYDKIRTAAERKAAEYQPIEWLS